MVRGNFIGYGLMYGTGGFVLDMIRCMILEELYWIGLMHDIRGIVFLWSAVLYWRDCFGYGLLYGSGGIVLDMVCYIVLEGLYWIWSAVWYWGNCIGYGLLYVT
jgi:hypothetical protein